VLLKLISSGEPGTPVRDIASSIGSVSKSAVDVSLQRLKAHALIREGSSGRQINRLAARDLFEKAVQWIAPAVVGPYELGLATAYAAHPLADKLRSDEDEDPVVMPVAEGPCRGRAVTPIHRAAPGAAKRDEKLHELLSIVDALRIGRARDREVAVSELRSRI
jgi:hypothetical protein